MNADESLRAEALLDCAETLGEVLTGGRLRGYLRLLADVALDDLRRALDAHMRDPERGKFFPRPADITAKLPRNLSAMHLPADAAWSLALRSMDERDTVVWTHEIEQARALSMEVWKSGDHIGARMAFRAAYDRIISSTQSPPEWIVSIGHDADRRVSALNEAVSRGMLSHEKAARHFPALTAPEGEGKAVAGLLSGNVVQIPMSDFARERIAEIRRLISTKVAFEDKRASDERLRREIIEAEKARQIAEAEYHQSQMEESTHAG